MTTPDRIRRRGRWSLVLGTVVAALLFGTIAYADIIAPDADFVTLGNQGSRNLGTVSPGTTLTPQVSFELQCGGNQHVDNGLSVSLTFDAAGSTIPPGASMNASSAAIGPIPAAWPEDQDQCSNPAPAAIQDNGNSTVTITAPTTPGDYSFVPKWNVVEPESSDVTGADPIVTFTLVVAAPPDTTPPVVSYALTPDSPDGNNDWYRSNVSLVWTVTEAESPGSLVKTGCVDQSITTDQDATTYSCSATSTGGSAGPVSVTIKRDATAPSAVTTLDTAPDGSNDWYTTSPAWTTNGADALSRPRQRSLPDGDIRWPRGHGSDCPGHVHRQGGQRDVGRLGSVQVRRDRTECGARGHGRDARIERLVHERRDGRHRRDGLDLEPGDVHGRPVAGDRDDGTGVQRLLHQQRRSHDERGSAHGEARQDCSQRRLHEPEPAGKRRGLEQG